jgi:hypothetical protein
MAAQRLDGNALVLLFPALDWAFHLLAMVNAAAGLYATDLIARRHLEGTSSSPSFSFSC